MITDKGNINTEICNVVLLLCQSNNLINYYLGDGVSLASHRSKSFKSYYAYLNNLVNVGDPTEEDEFFPLDKKSPRQVLSSNRKSKKVSITIITIIVTFVME